MHGHKGNFMYGPGPVSGEGPGFGGSPRVFFRGRPHRRARGDVRSAILLLLAEEPRNGYQIMQELEQRSGGTWRPEAPGRSTPRCKLLADEGLVTSEARGGGNVFELTDAGRAHLAEHQEHLGTPWEAVNSGATEGMIEIRSQLMQIADAARQVARSGNEAHVAAAAKLLAETRRALYGILAGE